MKKSLWAASVIVIFVGAFAFATAAFPDTSAGAKKNPEEIVMNSCASCHGLDVTCTRLGKKDKARWERMIYGMAQRGAKIDQADIPVVAEYLAGLKAGSKPVCK